MEEINKKINNVLLKNGGILISSIYDYKNARTKLIWKCKYDHEFKSDWNHVQQGKWCPFCAGRRISINDVKNIAKQRGGECLSNNYVKCIDKLIWKCANGHIWHASLNTVKNQNSWCPKCQDSFGEDICRYIFEFALKKQFIKIKPIWLMYNNKKLELDGYCSDLKIAFEYNGPHYYTKRYKNQDLSKVKKYDLFKKQKCVENNVKLCIIKDVNRNKFSIIKQHIKSFLIKENISFINFDNVSIDDIYNKSYQNKLSELAKQFNGHCLNKKYIGVNEKYTWKCENNHIWDATFDIVRQGYWCKECNKYTYPDNIISDLIKLKDKLEKSDYNLINSAISFIKKVRK